MDFKLRVFFSQLFFQDSFFFFVEMKHFILVLRFTNGIFGCLIVFILLRRYNLCKSSEKHVERVSENEVFDNSKIRCRYIRKCYFHCVWSIFTLDMLSTKDSNFCRPKGSNPTDTAFQRASSKLAPICEM